MTLWNREPAMILGVIETVLALVLAFGLDLSGEQVGAIMAAAAALLALITRSQVTPLADPRLGRDA